MTNFSGTGLLLPLEITKNRYWLAAYNASADLLVAWGGGYDHFPISHPLDVFVVYTGWWTVSRCLVQWQVCRCHLHVSCWPRVMSATSVSICGPTRLSSPRRYWLHCLMTLNHTSLSCLQPLASVSTSMLLYTNQIRDAGLTWVSFIYRTEPTTRKWKSGKLKTGKADMLRSIGKQSGECVGSHAKHISVHTDTQCQRSAFSFVLLWF